MDNRYIQAVKGFEGFSPRSQWDYKQHTNGFGTRAKYPGEVVSQAEAEQRLQDELTKANSYVKSLGTALSPGKEAALTDLTFNAGPKWMESGLGAAVRAGDWGTAKQKFLQYSRAGGQVLPGLQKRRQVAASWFDENPPMALGGPKEADMQNSGVGKFSQPNLMMSLGAMPGAEAQPMQSGAPMPTSALVSYNGMGPNEVAQRRAMAQALMKQGQDASPVQHWTQALARVLQGATGGYEMSQANEAEKQGTNSGNAALAAALQGGDINSALSNPYAAEQAMPIAMQQYKDRQDQKDPMYQARLGLIQAETRANDAKGAIDERRDAELSRLGIDPNSVEGITYKANGKLPAAAINQMFLKQNKQQAAPKIAAGLNDLLKQADESQGGANDAAFENALGPLQGANPDTQGLLKAPIANIARFFGEIANSVEGGNKTPNEVRNTIKGSTEALAAAIKPLIRAPGEGVWTDADQERLVSIVGDLSEASSKDEYKRRLNAVRDRLQSNFALSVPFDAMAKSGGMAAPSAAGSKKAFDLGDGFTAEVN